MVAYGRVQNGVVVLDDGVTLPEDQRVTVIVSAVETAKPPSEAARPSIKPHSILDVPTFSVGEILRLPSADDDLLGEMLEDRR